ncbi:hypothetical protein HDV00_001730 [Rhizophlyctis rosea]|nr:hypothetical protein HDV00_001730 [Rhizophlyctis rosea]
MKLQAVTVPARFLSSQMQHNLRELVLARTSVSGIDFRATGMKAKVLESLVWNDDQLTVNNLHNFLIGVAKAQETSPRLTTLHLYNGISIDHIIVNALPKLPILTSILLTYSPPRDGARMRDLRTPIGTIRAARPNTSITIRATPATAAMREDLVGLVVFGEVEVPVVRIEV